MKMRTKLRNAFLVFIRELELELRQSQNQKVTEIVNLWVEWNTKSKSLEEFFSGIEIILKDEIGFAWNEFNKVIDDEFETKSKAKEDTAQRDRGIDGADPGGQDARADRGEE